ncbi:superinfection immunity protein [Actinomadura geliboluensis]|uniref:superinfection immunity protein n=1 Tax=Actinomadura geliboluensis TaxID=882440 RepID=UPI003677CBAB
MTAIPDNPFFWLALIGILAILAVLPTLIALARGADDIGYIILVNVICAATVFGWPIALIATIAWPRRHPRGPAVLRRQRISPGATPASKGRMRDVTNADEPSGPKGWTTRPKAAPRH